MIHDDAFDFDRWAELIEQESETVEYTTPIKKRLRARALQKEEQLLQQRAFALESDFFWRSSSKHLTGRSTGTTR